ncbi:MAG: DUF2309 domain-containing protein [Burkholderiales bacterium]|jgi:uncharacterized protein YbcC (UPF0753/DUF2309 family)|uniref:YbcC family protein n=1 Tax=Limnobacter sp. TaxID=2003368 RepID=UPI0039BC6CA7|nr:DUF2309 domain-containing protein [Burkholderiales bacterium]
MKNLIEIACEQACQAIAPAWPLDKSIAVNPHWSRVNMPVRRVAARMAVLGGIQVFPPRVQIRQAWDDGRIQPIDLNNALQQLNQKNTKALTARQCEDALYARSTTQQLPLLIDVLDNDPQRHTRLSWRQAITHQVSQTCAAYFDEHQADWRPNREHGLYHFWRDTLSHDHGIGMLMGLPTIGQAIAALPSSAQEAEQWAFERLGLPENVWADYLESVLLTVNGWASWCAYLGWQARLQGKTDPHLRQLLAIRLAWGAILLECKDDVATRHAFAALQSTWRNSADAIEQTEQAMAVDEVWQLALELGYQRQLASELAKHTMQAKTPVQPQAKVQAAFCIDVRSEPLRRALEAAHPAIQTLGVAGFFGLPVDYTPMGSKASRPQLPGLLAPAMHVSDRVLMAGQTDGAQQQQAQENAESARQKRLSLLEQWRAAARWPGAAFSYVEAAGLGYLGKLSQWIKPTGGDRENDDLLGIPARYKALCRPQLLGLDLQSKTQLAAQVLNAMGLKTHIAPLVLLVGHGSQTTNNAHAASLDCGACCGQTGEVNARALAHLLNDSQVRSNLENNGFSIPASTWFVAGLHNTTTDEIEGFDIDLLPEDARKQWNELQAILITASDQTRRERAPSLGLNAKATPQALLEQVKRRANDGAQTRPEWGLAGNAAFLIAPRYRSAGANLQGRSFLHDYDVTQDPEGQLLEQLMTAPMLVTHWINWQYHASRCDPARLGSGNKLLHNVVGGTLGVFEGNGGDLRIGLSEQSLHNGKRWMHEPLRLTVIIDAPSAMIQRVIDKHAIVQQLVNNDWLHLWRFAEGGFERYSHGKWLSVSLLEQEHEWIAQT